MIIPMLKYSFLIYHREYDAFLKKLQDLGVLHIHWRPTGEDNEILRDLFRKMTQLEKLIRMLKKRQPADLVRYRLLMPMLWPLKSWLF